MFNIIEKKQDIDLINKFMDLGFDKLSSIMLINRNCKDLNDAKILLNNSSDDLHSYKDLPDIERAVDVINDAVTSNEKILIYGDYDADGLTSVALLYSYLNTKTENIDYYIPDRNKEGYGMNKDAIDKIAKDGTKLIITVDNGISSFEEIEYAYSLGLKCIVTDHHRTVIENGQERIPKCEAVVNPMRSDSKYPFPYLAGVGVAYKLVCAFEKQDFLQDYISLAAIGTVSDLMPLKDENRIIVYHGIEQLKINPPKWCRILFEMMFFDIKNIGVGTIAYQIAPRVNSAGRVGDVNVAATMFLSEYYNEIREAIQTLSGYNDKRKEYEKEILDSLDINDILLRKDKIIIESVSDKSSGVLGIVASRLVDFCNKPVILFNEEGDELRGSARSINGINIYDLISNADVDLMKFGGHASAAGLTIRKSDYSEFKKSLIKLAEKIDDQILCKNVDVECEIDTRDMTIDNIQSIQRFEPFGESNPEPVFYIKDCIIKDIYPIGRGRYLKLTLEDKNGGTFDAVSFGLTFDTFPCTFGDKVNIICGLKDDNYGGKHSVSCVVKYIEDCSIENGIIAAKTRKDEYYRYMDIKKEKEPCDISINRDDIVCLYKHIRRGCSMTDENTRNFSFTYISRYLDGFNDLKEPEIKILIALDILTELNQIDYSLVGFNGVSEDLGISVTLKEPQKADLSQSATFLRFNRK